MMEPLGLPLIMMILFILLDIFVAILMVKSIVVKVIFLLVNMIRTVLGNGQDF